MIRIFYIPGLGDSYDSFRKTALRRWNRPECRAYLVRMYWNDSTETYLQKYQRVVTSIRRNADANDYVVLVGESAGGAMALYAMVQLGERIDQVITVCGYNHGAAALTSYHKRIHPAFCELMPHVDVIVAQLSEAQRAKITTIYSENDRMVPKEHSLIAATARHRLATSGHRRTIARQLATKGPLKFIALAKNTRDKIKT